MRTPVALAAILLAGLVIQLVLPSGEDGGPAPAPPRRHAVTPPAAPATGLAGDFPAILAHPLFSPDRTGAGTAGGTAAEGPLTLAGVGSGPGGGSAILRTADGALQTLALGQSSRGWRLIATSADAAVLEREGVRQVLRVGAPPPSPQLPTPPPSSPMAQAPPPAAPPTFSVHGNR